MSAFQIITNGKSFALFVISFLSIIALGFLGLAVFVGLSKPESSLPTNPMPLVQSTAEVPLNHAFMVSMLTGKVTEFHPDDVMVFMPAKPASIPGYISITRQEPNLLSGDDSEWIRPLIVNIEYNDREGNPQPGMSFNSDYEICFGLDDSNWNQFMLNPDNFQIEYYETTSGPARWKAVPTKAYPERNQLCGKSRQVALFGLAIRDTTSPAVLPTETKGPYEP